MKWKKVKVGDGSWEYYGKYQWIQNSEEISKPSKPRYLK